MFKKCDNVKFNGRRSGGNVEFNLKSSTHFSAIFPPLCALDFSGNREK